MGYGSKRKPPLRPLTDKQAEALAALYYGEMWVKIAYIGSGIYANYFVGEVDVSGRMNQLRKRKLLQFDHTAYSHTVFVSPLGEQELQKRGVI